MEKKLVLVVVAVIAILAFANNTFAFGGQRGGGFRHQESRQEFRRDYHRRNIVIVERRPCRPVYVCPPRVGIIIGPFAIIGF